MKQRGFFAIGVWHPKSGVNVGTLWRSAYLYDAAFIFTVGARYRKQSSDTPHTHLHIPLFHFATIEDLIEHLPCACSLTAVELTEAKALPQFTHLERECYLLGAEDYGLSPEVLSKCRRRVMIPSCQPRSMNVAVAGSIVLYDRYAKGLTARVNLSKS